MDADALNRCSHEIIVGLLVNFHVPHLRDGIRRLVNGLAEPSRPT